MTALRSCVPFGKMWGMRLDHPYSSLVTEGDYAWTCGQCPLDTSGNVLYANDLVAQAKLVAGTSTSVWRMNLFLHHQ